MCWEIVGREGSQTKPNSRIKLVWEHDPPDQVLIRSALVLRARVSSHWSRSARGLAGAPAARAGISRSSSSPSEGGERALRELHWQTSTHLRSADLPVYRRSAAFREALREKLLRRGGTEDINPKHLCLTGVVGRCLSKECAEVKTNGFHQHLIPRIIISPPLLLLETASPEVPLVIITPDRRICAWFGLFVWWEEVKRLRKENEADRDP